MLVLILACRPSAPEQSESEVRSPTPARTPPPQSEVERNGPTVVFLGNSLTAGLGLGEEQAFPALVSDLLRQADHPARVVNAGVSGDTTAGGLRRLDWLLRQDPDVVVVALGGNDGLRGLSLEMSEDNLREIMVRASQTGAEVILAGIQIPPNYGPDYTERFAAMYPRLAAELDVPFIEFLLAGVGGVPELNQPDGIHPTAAGQRRIAENVMPRLLEVLAELEDRPHD